MSNDNHAGNPVADLLARHTAPDLVGGIRAPASLGFPMQVRYGHGKPGSRGISGAKLPLIVGAVLVLVSLIAGISAVRSGDFGLNQSMAIGLPLFIAAFVAGPALLRARKGNLQWRRDATIGADGVEVTDKADRATASWTAPLSDYRDIHHAFHWVSVGDGEGLDLEVVTLRHRDPAKSIYVSGTRKTAMGGMNAMELIRAGYEGRRDDVEAAVGDTRNPHIEALVAAIADETGLPVVQDFN